MFSECCYVTCHFLQSFCEHVGIMLCCCWPIKPNDWYWCCMDPSAVSLLFVYFQAALAGGTTMVIGHVLPEKNESLLDAYEKCRSHADAKACCDYALHVGVTWWGPKVQSVFVEYTKSVSIVEFPKLIQFFYCLSLWSCFDTICVV